MNNKLVLDNEKLVYLVIKDLKLWNSIEDYYDVGMIGLVKASNTWNINRETKFSTYAYNVIKNEILQEIN